jgi:hypothetical protein
MNIFNDKTVVGLFDTDQAVEVAITELHKQGFGQEEDEIRIVDENRLSQETPIGPLTQGAGAAIPGPGPTRPVGPLETKELEPTIPESAATERKVKELLTDKGFGNEEASFYAQHVRRGSALVIVKTTEEQAPKALDIMKRANAKASMA